VWPLVSGANSSSPRAVLPLDAKSIIVGDWKLLIGSVSESGWTGYVYPNASTAAGARIDGKHDCGERGCLFNGAAIHLMIYTSYIYIIYYYTS
jgi:hypothetical protein